MTSPIRRHLVMSFLVLAPLLVPFVTRAGEIEKTSGPVTIRLESEGEPEDPRVVPVSGKLRLTVMVAGPPVPVVTYLPLRLSREWEVKPDPPESEKLDDGTVRWRQKFVLDPRGKVGKLSLQLEPLQVGS